MPSSNPVGWLVPIVNHLILVWVLTASGGWKALPPWHFASYDRCIRMSKALERRTDKPRYIDIPKLYYKPGKSSGVMFVEKCGKNE